MWGCFAWSATSIASKRIFRNLKAPSKTWIERQEGEALLVDRFQGAGDRQVILEFNRDALIRQRLENWEY
jgi:hypothetical protein